MIKSINCFSSVVVFFTLFLSGLTFTAADAALCLRPTAYQERGRQEIFSGELHAVGRLTSVRGDILFVNKIPEEARLASVVTRALFDIDRLITAQNADANNRHLELARKKNRDSEEKLDQILRIAVQGFSDRMPPETDMRNQNRAWHQLAAAATELFDGSPLSLRALLDLLEARPGRTSCDPYYLDAVKEGLRNAELRPETEAAYLPGDNAELKQRAILRIRGKIAALVDLATDYSAKYPPEADSQYNGNAKRRTVMASVVENLYGAPCNHEDLGLLLDSVLAEKQSKIDPYYEKAVRDAFVAVHTKPDAASYWGTQPKNVNVSSAGFADLRTTTQEIICIARYAESWVPYDETIRKELISIIDDYIAGRELDKRRLYAARLAFENMMNDSGVVFDIFSTIRHDKYVKGWGWMVDQVCVKADQIAADLPSISKDPSRRRQLANCPGLTIDERSALRRWADSYTEDNKHMEKEAADALAFIGTGQAGLRARAAQLPKSDIRDAVTGFFGLSRSEKIAAIKPMINPIRFGTTVAQLTEEYATGVIELMIRLMTEKNGTDPGSAGAAPRNYERARAEAI